MNVEQIYQEQFDIVYRYLICLTHNKEIAEDLAQETFYRAIIHINHFDGKVKTSTWLCEIAKNLWLNELKKMKRISSIDTQEDDIDALYNLEEEFINKQDLQFVYEQIKKFDKDIKEIFYLRLLAGMSFKEIGEIKGKTEVWARVNFYRGKQKIKEVEENERKKRM